MTRGHGWDAQFWGCPALPDTAEGRLRRNRQQAAQVLRSPPTAGVIYVRSIEKKSVPEFWRCCIIQLWPSESRIGAPARVHPDDLRPFAVWLRVLLLRAGEDFAIFLADGQGNCPLY